MMSKKILISIGLLTGLLSPFKQLRAQTYLVRKINSGLLHVTGRGDSKAWTGADTLTAFTYPWDTAAAPATSFSALWDGRWLYLLYTVQDDSVIVYARQNTKREIGASDRAEIFMKADDRMSPYYCLELDASGRIMDYRAWYYRKMDYDWQWPKGQLIVKTSRTSTGYKVEAAISIASLKALGLLKDNRLQAGLFRAECKGITRGRADLRWISWIRPPVAEPDFHIPSAFGTLVLQ